MNAKLPFTVIAGLALGLGSLHAAWADDPDNDYERNGNWPSPQIQTRVESRSDGVYIQIEVRQRVPGTNQAPPPQPTGGRPATGTNASATTASTTSGSTAASAGGDASAGRTWTDATGIHHETADGRRISLTPPLVSSATRESWTGRLQQHPNEDPYLVYVNDQFGGLIWVPRSSSADELRFGPPPADGPLQVGAPPGTGQVVDPREIALGVLRRLPLPDIQIRVNPALGLVALPGWFWVEGYDGEPFGASQSVNVPPAVGPEVPSDAVPAGDPRRRGNSVTVEVQLRPSRYEWSFGDGATLMSQSLGKPYPTQSDIQHTYEYSSLQSPNGFPVRLLVEFTAQYRVNGGAPQALPPLRRAYETSYRVQEAQPVLTGR